MINAFTFITITVLLFPQSQHYLPFFRLSVSVGRAYTNFIFSIPQSARNMAVGRISAISNLILFLLCPITRAQTGSNPVCNVCKQEGWEPQKPDVEVKIPANNFVANSTATCKFIYDYGMDGQLPKFACTLAQTNAAYQGPCECGPENCSGLICAIQRFFAFLFGKCGIFRLFFRDCSD